MFILSYRFICQIVRSVHNRFSLRYVEVLDSGPKQFFLYIQQMNQSRTDIKKIISPGKKVSSNFQKMYALRFGQKISNMSCCFSQNNVFRPKTAELELIFEVLSFEIPPDMTHTSNICMFDRSSQIHIFT